MKTGRPFSDTYCDLFSTISPCFINRDLTANVLDLFDLGLEALTGRAPNLATLPPLAFVIDMLGLSEEGRAPA